MFTETFVYRYYYTKHNWPLCITICSSNKVISNENIHVEALFDKASIPMGNVLDSKNF